MDTIYVVLRFLLNKSTKNLMVKPVMAFTDQAEADLWILRRTQVKGLDWYVVEQCPMEMPRRSIFGRR